MVNNDFSGRSHKRLEGTVENGEFWPAIDLGDFQETMRIPAEYRVDTITQKVTLACVVVNRELNIERCTWVRDGYDTLAYLPAEQVGGESESLELYRQAVYNQAKAYLMQVYPSMNRRDRADHEGRDADTVEQLENASAHAIRLLRGYETTIDVVVI